MTEKILTSTGTDSTVADITLVDFAKPVNKWSSGSDTVMGGASSRHSFTIANGYGTLSGNVVELPRARIPGFIRASAPGVYPDVAGCKSLAITSKSTISYDGYYISFGTNRSS